ncbi:MAG: MarR family transcriptional regulator [Actinomycetia bacterium]|nr:MarR family transcriptional regulator [Actinomycetes bacterium]
MCTQITYTEIMPPEKLKQGPLPVEDRAFYGLVWAGNTLTARVGQALMRRHDLTLSWFEVLLWLSDQDSPVSVSGLGACTMLSRSQVSRVLDAMQDRGLITRTPSPSDARSVAVALTPAGRELFTDADATRRESLAEVFTGRLGTDDLTALIRVWQKLKATG